MKFVMGTKGGNEGGERKRILFVILGIKGIFGFILNL